MKMRAVLFDVDGTLVDSVDSHAIAWQEAFAAFGHEIELRRIRNQIGKGGDELIPVFLTASERRRHAREIEAYRLATFRAKYLPKIAPFAQVRALFARLRKDGWKLALASSSNRDDLTFFIKRLGVGAMLDVVTTTEDAHRSKPKPDIFLAAKTRLQSVDASSCIVVGDSPYDHIAARRAGMISIGLLSGGFPGSRLRAAGAAEIYHDVADLLLRYRTSLFALE